MRKLIWTLSIVFILLVLVGGGTYGLLSTQSGSRWLIKMGVNRALPGLTFHDTSGNLLTGISLNAVRYSAQSYKLSFEKVSLLIEPKELFKGDMHIPWVKLSGGKFGLFPFNEMIGNAFLRQIPKWTLPITLTIDKAQFYDNQLTYNGADYKISGFEFDVCADRKGIDIRRGQVGANGLTISGRGSFRYDEPLPLELWTNWTAELSHPDQLIAGRSAMAFGEQKIRFHHQITTPVLMQTSGEIAIDSASGDKHPVRINADLSGRQLPDATISAEGNLDRNGMIIETLEAEMLGGIAIATGNISWNPSPLWSFHVSGKGFSPARKWRQWDGDLAIDLKTTGEWKADGYHADILGLDLSGSLKGNPFEITGDLQLTDVDNSVHLNPLNIQYGHNACILNGSIGNQMDLKVDGEIKAPENLWTGFKGGPIKAAGRLSGPLTMPSGDLTVTGANVAYGEYLVEEMAVKISADSGDLGNTNALIDLSGVRAADALFSKVWLKLQGEPAGHRLQAGLTTAGIVSEIQLTGQSHDDYWRGRLERGVIQNSSDGNWRLKAPASIEFNYREVKSFSSCWANGDRDKCLMSAWEDKVGLSLVGDIQDVPFRTLTTPMRALFNKENLGWKKQQH